MTDSKTPAATYRLDDIDEEPEVVIEPTEQQEQAWDDPGPPEDWEPSE